MAWYSIHNKSHAARCYGDAPFITTCEYAGTCPKQACLPESFTAYDIPVCNDSNTRGNQEVC